MASRSAFPWAKHGKPAARWKGSESQLNLSQPTPLYSGQKRSGNVRKPMNSIEFQPGTLPGRLGSVLATSLLQLQMHRPTRLNCRSTSAKQEATLYFTSLGKPRLLWPSIVCFKASEELRMSIQGAGDAWREDACSRRHPVDLDARAGRGGQRDGRQALC